MSKRILIVSPDIEDTSSRGIGTITKNLVHSLKELDVEIGLLVGMPRRKHFKKSDLYDAKIDHIYLQHYLKEGRDSFKYLVHGGYNKINILKATLKRSIYSSREIRIDESLLSQQGSLLHNLNFCIESPYYYQFLVRNYKKVAKKELRNIVERHNIDVVITTAPAIITSRDLGEKTKLAQFVHDFMPIEIIETPPDNETPFKFAQQIYDTVHGSDMLLVNSEDTMRKILQENREAHVEVLYGALPSKIPDTRGSTILKSKNLRPNGYLVYAGAIEKRKNIETILSAYALVASNINMPLVFIGSPGYGFKDILSKYKELPEDIRQNILFTGYVTEVDKYALLENARCFLFPTIYEGLGLPVLEAMACGTPVLASRVGALPEAGGEAAYYVDNPYDSAEISEGILKIVGDESLRKHMQEKGYAHIKRFTQDKFLDRTKTAIERLLVK